MVNWPDDLVKDIAKRKTVIFFGAGVSCNSKNKHGKSPKDWGDLLQHMSNSIQTVSVKAEVQDLIRSYDYLAACEIIKRVIPIRTYEKLLREEYATPGYSHAAIHENIGRLGARYVITPNIDRIYETYIQSQINSSIRIKTLRDMDLVDCIRDGDDMIIKLHGSINEPQHLVFTAKEYSEARVAHKRTYEAVYALAVTHSFLFIGCGMNDPDIRLLLEDLNFTHRSTRPHY